MHGGGKVRCTLPYTPTEVPYTLPYTLTHVLYTILHAPTLNPCILNPTPNFLEPELEILTCNPDPLFFFLIAP